MTACGFDPNPQAWACDKTNKATSISYKLVDAVFRNSDYPRLHLNSTNTNFDCVPFDRRVADIWTGKSYPDVNQYTCVTLDSQGNDISPANPPYKQPIDGPTKGVIAGAVVGSVLVVAFIAWCIWTQRKQRKMLAARARERAARGDDIELDNVAGASAYYGHTRRRESGEQPPRYARTGKPGEVPPTYSKFPACL